ncbi:hypothetical protein BIW11_03739, partial [Tropilaelaps mercedesae]
MQQTQPQLQSAQIQQALSKKSKDVMDRGASGSGDKDKKEKDKSKKKEAKAKSKMMLMIRNGVPSSDVKLYGTVDPPEAILEAAKSESLMQQQQSQMMEQTSTSSMLLMSASMKSSRPESVASIGSLNSTKSAPAKAQQPQAIDSTEWSPYKRRGGSGEDSYATLEGIQRAYLHHQEHQQQQMQWQQSMATTNAGLNNATNGGNGQGQGVGASSLASQGASGHHLLHHPSLHPPRTSKSLLHEAESMESLLSAHSQQQMALAQSPPNYKGQPHTVGPGAIHSDQLMVSPGQQTLQQMRLMMQARSPHSSPQNSPYSSPQKAPAPRSSNGLACSQSSICYSPPSTPQRSNSSMSHHRFDISPLNIHHYPMQQQYSPTTGGGRSMMSSAGLTSSLTSSATSPYHQLAYQQPSTYASSSLKINRAERRQALDYASKTLPHNATANGNSRLSQGGSRFLYSGSPGLSHATPPRGVRFPKDDDGGCGGLGSTLSLVSTTSSMYSSPEERHALELRRLRKELEHSNDKVVTLTAQLT